MISSYGLSDVGRMRRQNEDRILVDDRLALFAVADGMGGHSYGEVAAEMALRAMQEYIDASRDGAPESWPLGYSPDLTRDQNRLVTAVRLANRRVWAYSEDNPEFAGMGTTLAAVLVSGGRAAVAAVGDSRVYLFRCGELQPLTTDDTWVGAMLRQGALQPREAARHPMRHVLTQAAGARENIEVEVLEVLLADGDLLLLSSDGLHAVVDEADIQAILSAHAGKAGSLQQAGARLIEAAWNQGAPDNISSVLLRYRAGPDPL